MYRAFPGADYSGGSASVWASRRHTRRAPTGGSPHTFPCCVCHRHRMKEDVLYPPYPAPAGVTAPIRCSCRSDRAPGSTGYPAGRLSFAHRVQPHGRGDGIRRFSRAFTSVRHHHTQPGSRRSRWRAIATTCSQGFGPWGVLHPSPAWSGSGPAGARLDTEHCDTHLWGQLAPPRHGARSRTSTSRSLPASMTCAVTAASSGDGVGSPLGWSGRRAPLPVHTPPRTGRDRFRSSGSSLSNAPRWNAAHDRGGCHGHSACTIVRWCRRMNRPAAALTRRPMITGRPHRHRLMPPAALPPSDGDAPSLVPRDQVEVGPLSRGVMLPTAQPLSRRLPPGIRLLHHPLPASRSPCLTAGTPCRERYGLTVFIACNRMGEVRPLRRWCRRSVSGAITVPEPTTAPSAQALVRIAGPIIVTAVTRRSLVLTIPSTLAPRRRMRAATPRPHGRGCQSVDCGIRCRRASPQCVTTRRRHPRVLLTEQQAQSPLRASSNCTRRLHVARYAR